MSAEICPVCGEPVKRGQPRFIDAEGKHYHEACAKTLPPTKPQVLAKIANFALDEVARQLITPALMRKVKERFKEGIDSYRLTDEEIAQAVKARLFRA